MNLLTSLNKYGVIIKIKMIRNIPNDKSKALRYLLLRHLSKAKNSTSSEIFKEVTNSLKIEKKENHFQIIWVRNGKSFNKEYDQNQFHFFTQGDKVNDNYKIDYRKNDNNAKTFVKEAFNINNIKYANDKKLFFSLNPIVLFSYFLYTILFFIIEKNSFLIGSIIIFFLFICEFWYIWGKFFIPPLLLGFIMIDLPYTGLIGLIVFSILLLFETNKKLLLHCFLFSIVNSLVVIFYIVFYKEGPFINYCFFLLLIITASIFIMNWIIGSHFRTFPLIFPFLSIGMYFDMNFSLVTTCIICSLISVLINHKGNQWFRNSLKKIKTIRKYSTN